MGHKVGRDKEYMWAIMAEYIQTNVDGINVVAGDYLQWKGQTLDDYVELKVPGHKGDKLSVYLLACIMNFKAIIVTKTGYCTVDDCDVLSADIVLVYLRKSMFRDTVPIPTKTTPIPIDDELNKHEVPKVINPNHQVTRSMGEVIHVKTPPPSSPHKPKGSKPKQRKP